MKWSLQPPQKNQDTTFLVLLHPKEAHAAPYVLNLKLLGTESLGSAQVCKQAHMKPKGHHPAGEFRQAAHIQVHKQ